LTEHLKHPVLELVSKVASQSNLRAYVVGGWVRDLLLGRPSKDVDIVVEGSGIELANLVAQKIGKHDNLKVFKNFGTAMLRFSDHEIEFVGARKESYRLESRKPIVEDGTLHDDLSRRDFTINSMAIGLSGQSQGKLIDPFNGQEHLQHGILKTPLEPGITYSDDPLRMMRALRFAAQLQFDIEKDSFEAIKENAHRLSIVSMERILEEFNKIVMTPNPGKALLKVFEAGLLQHFFHELQALSGVGTVKGKTHKDVLLHTFKVLDNLAPNSENLWLRWAVLLHDIAKPATKRFDAELGWTFHGHEFVGSKMVPRIFARLKLPLDAKMKYVQKLVLLHLRPIVLSQEIVTDSAVRRLLFEAGDEIDDLMLLCEADITSGNRAKVIRFMENFRLVRRKLVEIEEKDRLRNWQPPITGDEIMTYFGVKPSREVGIIKTAIREAILDGEIPNEREPAWNFMIEQGKNIGLLAANKTN